MPETRRRSWLAAVGLAGLVSLAPGCGGGAGELLDTAQFEEVQNNPGHARELYEEIVRRYPGTEEARTAAERLRALAGTP